MRQKKLFECWSKVAGSDAGKNNEDEDDAPLMPAEKRRKVPSAKEPAKRQRKLPAKAKEKAVNVATPVRSSLDHFNLDMANAASSSAPSLPTRKATEEVGDCRDVANAASSSAPSLPARAGTEEVGECREMANAISSSPPSLPTRAGPVTDKDLILPAQDLKVTNEVHHKDLSAATMSLERDGINAFAAECMYNYHLTCNDYTYPSWLQAEKLRDANGRRPTHPDYDQRTLWVPSEQEQKEEKAGTPMLLQYWKVKAQHFDKIAFFKVGKFYEIFYLDAVIAQRVCGLNWMNTAKPHVGFPEVALHENAGKIVQGGYSAVVVEQTETVEEACNRTGTKTALVQRAACEVFTRGTLVHHDMVSARDNNYLAVLWYAPVQDGSRPGELPSPYDFAVILVDTATGDARVGSFRDVADRNALRTMMAQVQPKEIVYHPANVALSTIKMLKLMPSRPKLSPFCEMPCSVTAAEAQLARFQIEYPEDVRKRLAQGPVIICTGAAFAYLKSIMLDEQVIPFMSWSVYDPFLVTRFMMLDATAITNLDVVETEDGKYKGSLLHFIDKTCTAFGFRLLKMWLCAPLLQPEEINARLDCVEFFNKSPMRTASMKVLKALPDLERMTARVSAFGVQGERHAVMYGDQAGSRMKDFLKLLASFDEVHKLVCRLQGAGLPERLNHLVNFQPKGMFPDVSQLTAAFRSKIETVDGIDGKTVYRPCQGVFSDYDVHVAKMRDMESEFDSILATWQRKYPQADLKYLHRLPAYRYEIEVPEDALPKSVVHSKELDITSTRKGYIRFQTPQIKDLVVQFESVAQKAKDALYPFMSSIFKEFHRHASSFSLASSVVAEIDALISLSIVCDCPYGPMVRPEFCQVGADDVGILDIKDLRHPVAEYHNNTFVPNDVSCGGEQPAILLVTGPNMGGKSTVLRQTCIGVILAQIGCKVPATRCRLTPVDRIFTRVGAQDSLIDGKSTFLMELEETAAILHFGTKRSLAAIDELGRGTSTFDGAAIALSTLEHLATKTQCRCLFATHYHLLGTYQSPMVASFHMAADIDAHTGELTFLYKFREGHCPDSHGRNVARLAGLPEEVSTVAQQKSLEWRRSHDMQGTEFLMLEVARLAKANNITALTALLMKGGNARQRL